jgi:hypothetical protein
MRSYSNKIIFSTAKYYSFSLIEEYEEIIRLSIEFLKCCASAGNN